MRFLEVKLYAKFHDLIIYISKVESNCCHMATLCHKGLSMIFQEPETSIQFFSIKFLEVFNSDKQQWYFFETFFSANILCHNLCSWCEIIYAESYILKTLHVSFFRRATRKYCYIWLQDSKLDCNHLYLLQYVFLALSVHRNGNFEIFLFFISQRKI